MTTKTILVDPVNEYEVVPDSQELADAFNRSNPDHVKQTAQDMDDLNQMFLEAGLLLEMSIQ